MRPNTDCQDQRSSRPPVASSPTTAAPPATAAHTLTAFVRCASGTVLVIVESVAGITSAAPMPSTPRSAISSVAERAVIAAADPRPKIASPAISARRRPWRSPNAPPGSSSAATSSE